MDDIVKINAVGALYAVQQYKRVMEYKVKKEDKIEPIERSPETNTSRDFYDEHCGRNVNLLI